MKRYGKLAARVYSGTKPSEARRDFIRRCQVALANGNARLARSGIARQYMAFDPDRLRRERETACAQREARRATEIDRQIDQPVPHYWGWVPDVPQPPMEEKEEKGPVVGDVIIVDEVMVMVVTATEGFSTSGAVPAS